MRSPPRASLSGSEAPAPLVALHLCIGAPLLLAPGTVLGGLPNQHGDRAGRLFARLLGARHLAEAAVLARCRGREWILAGAAVDATHAVSMVLLAWLRPARRRLALSSAAGAMLLAACTLAYARRVGPTGPGVIEGGG